MAQAAASAASTGPSPPSPLVHAMGGSLGSAIALLVFYPLERARIELQSQAAASPSPQLPPLPPASPSRSDGGAGLQILPSVGSSSADDSWTQAGLAPRTPPRIRRGRTESDSDSPSAWSASEIRSEPGSPLSLLPSIESDEIDEVPSSTSLGIAVAERNRKLGLLQCLLRLRARGELYKGVRPVVTTVFASQFVFFYANVLMKRILLLGWRRRRQERRFQVERDDGNSPIVSLVSSCLAGIANVLLTNPLWVVNMAIVTGTTETNSLWKEFRAILKRRGPKHMWTGVLPSILLVSNPVIQFFCYEQFKQSRLRVRGVGHGGVGTQTLGAVEAFALGAASKAIATVATYPLQLAQTALRMSKQTGRGRGSDDEEYRGTVDCLARLFRRGGLGEWFTGMRAKMLQTVLTSAFMFLTYEQILSAVQVALIKQVQPCVRTLK